MELSFETLTKLISEDSNKVLSNFIEDISCSIEEVTFLQIINYILKHQLDYDKVSVSLGKDLKDYDVAYDDEDCLTAEGEDFLILYIHHTISNERWKEWRRSVGM